MNKLQIAFLAVFILVSLFATELTTASPSYGTSTYPVAPPESANWQEEANASIDKIRKGEVEIVVKDGEGKSIPQVKVSLEQQSHDFRFGVAISDATLIRYQRDPAILTPYQQTVKDYFNSGSFSSALKWFYTEQQQGKINYQTADEWLKWCEQNGIRMHGHCIFWEDEKTNSIENALSRSTGYTGWVSNLDKDSLRKAVEQRAKDVTSRYQGRITEYDVDIEMLYNNFFRSRLGQGIIGDMFRWATEGDPKATFYLDEYIYPPSATAAESLVQLIKSLLDQGIPLGGIGIQAHFSDFEVNGMPQPSMPEWKAVLDKLAVFKLPIRISGYGYETQYIVPPMTTKPVYDAQSEEKKAQCLGDFYRLCFSHPAVEGILMWGHWEGAHWRPGAAILNLDFSPKPAADAYRKLVFNEWWTKISGETNSEGKFSTRAFYGRYKVSIQTRDGKTEEKTFNFPKGTTLPLSIVFDIKASQTVKPAASEPSPSPTDKGILPSPSQSTPTRKATPPPTQSQLEKEVAPPTPESPIGGFSCSSSNASANQQDISLLPLALVFGLVIILKKTVRKP